MSHEFHISFHFNGTKRSRALPLLPRIGDIVQMNDAENGDPPEWFSLQFDSIYTHEDGHDWTYLANCTLKA